jgi:hypothetical protein
MDVTISSPVHSDDLFVSDSYKPWDPYDDSSQQQRQANKLNLCQFADWDSERTYDEDPPSYIHYSIEWKVMVNNRAIMPKDTEQDIVLAPADYWEHSGENVSGCRSLGRKLISSPSSSSSSAGIGGHYL